MTVKQILELGWQMTGIPDAISCAKDPNWSACLSTLASVLPIGKGAKALKGLVESKRAERALDYIKDVDDVIKDDVGPACPIPHSFTGDTRVLMADGTSKPISDVKVGDKITNADPDSGKLEHHVVTAVHVTTDDRDRVDLELAGSDNQVVHTTEHHQIWEARTHHWVEAGQLQSGDQVRSSTSIATVVRVLHHAGRGKTYDLTVEDQHTYYVLAGNMPVLVHNSLSCDGVSPNGWPKPTMDNCKECAQKIQDRIGGQIYHVKDSEGAPFLGPSKNDPHGSWTEHYTVIKDGTAYDAFTGPEGMPLDQYRAQWQYGDYLSFTPYNP